MKRLEPKLVTELTCQFETDECSKTVSEESKRFIQFRMDRACQRFHDQWDTFDGTFLESAFLAWHLYSNNFNIRWQFIAPRIET